MIPKMSFGELAEKYCERQDSDPPSLLMVLQAQRANFSPDGWMLLENPLLDSSQRGRLYVLAYGPNNTCRTLMETPFTINGLASGTVCAIGHLPVGDLPDDVETA